MLADHGVYLRRRGVLEARPAQRIVGEAAAFAEAVLAFRKDPPLYRLVQAVGLVLGQQLQVVPPAQKQQLGDLLDYFDRVGDATRPESVPDGVDPAA